MDLALSEEFREGNSVTGMRIQLQELQAELAMAHKKLHETEDLVARNERQVALLQEEAVSISATCRVPISRTL